MNSHVENQVTIFDLQDDIMHNHISKYLLEDKQTNKIFNEKDDYYLQMLYLVKLKSSLMLLDMKQIHTKYKCTR
jgi:hypothetical protein